MQNLSNSPVTKSAALHAERIRAKDQARAAQAAPERPADKSTAQLYAERALAGVQADEALRQEAYQNDKRARGEWVPGDEPEAEEEDLEEYDEEEYEGDDEDPPKTTAELYARRVRGTYSAEGAAARVAHKSVVLTAGRVIIM
ncbi:hypothetical protein PV350_35400 [Streptomyces sp. PA03-6a]|nr:hypothetical protein [Streptomyces sp. PA03-6a]